MPAELSRLNHAGAAPTTGLASSITGSSTGCVLNSGAGYPTSNFVLKLDGGTISEEKVLCSNRSGTAVTFAVGGRGFDGTSPTSHTGPAPANVEHCFTSIEADDTNRHIYTAGDDDHTQYARTDGTRTVTGAQTFGAGVTVSAGGAQITGNSKVTGTLEVTGAVTVDSGGAAVTGNSTVTGNAHVTGNTTVDGTLTVAGGLVVPPGVIWDYGAASAPTGWLLCDGTAVSRTTYAALFSAVGTTWGVGDGSTTFNVPDLRGRVTAGVGSVGTNSQPTVALAATGGEKNHTLVTGELPVHNHTLTDPQHSHGSINGTGTGTNGGWIEVVNSSSTEGLMASPTGTKVTGNAPSSVTTGNAATGITLGTAGSGTAHNNMQPYAGVTKIIKT
jgi:microcystin-dependent protein